VTFNDSCIHILNYLMMVPMWPKHVGYENTFLLCRRFLANYLYICNTQQDAHYEDRDILDSTLKKYFETSGLFNCVCLL
jgi:hypothetical protein